jgi:L-fuconolactonase
VIVDVHHHLWDPATREYGWMSGPFAPLRRPRGLDDLRAVTTPAGVTATVAVQAALTEEETVELLSLATGSNGLVAGVVGWVDVTAPDVPDRIGALRAGPGGDRLVGIRDPVQHRPDPDWLDRDDVRRGLRAVVTAGLVFDLVMLPHHLPAATRLAAALPELALGLDHGAKPPIAAGGWEPWSSDLGALAASGNVCCKLSGLVTEAPWDGWRSAGVERYAARLLEAFGPERLMFGSDWPVCTLAASYADVLELAQRTLAGLSASERDAVMAGTARRVYGLGA